MTLPQFDFEHMQLPKSKGYYLVCPSNYCQGKQNEISPTFAVPRDQVEATWVKIAKTLPRTQLLSYDAKNHTYLYYQHSLSLHFVDYIFMQFTDLGQGKSSVMMYSEARNGAYDFKINKERSRLWLKLLNNALVQK